MKSASPERDVAAAEARMNAADQRLGPRGIRIFPFQREGVRLLASYQRGANFDDPGLGKTAEVCLAVPDRAPLLVGCPSAVKYTWARELRVWRPEYAVRIVRTARAFRWPRRGEAVIINWEILPPAHREILRLSESLDRMVLAGAPARDVERTRRKLHRLELTRRRMTFPHDETVMVADEAHRVKNPKAICTLRWRELVALALSRGGRSWPVTATPWMNRRTELWTVLQSAGLGTEAWGTRTAFEADCHPSRQEEFVRKLRSVSFKRLRSEVLPQLPPKRRETVEVPLDKATTALSDELMDALLARGVDIETASLRAIRTACDERIVRDRVSRLRAALATAKIKALHDLVDRAEEERTHLVVFSCHRAPLEVVGARRRWGMISGSESAEQKTKTERLFQAGKLRGVACGVRSAGEGITLHRAWWAVFVDLDWNPAKNNQAEDRICRIGQTAQGLLYTRLVADHALERRLERLIRRKQTEIDRTVTASAIAPEGAS